MRIITRKRLEDAARRHAKAAPTLRHWHAVASRAAWKNLVDVRQTFPHADPVRVASARTVTVFNLANALRLITAIHYNRRCVYILSVLTHAEYDRDAWKGTL
jgi:mRNA interferase HigB